MSKEQLCNLSGLGSIWSYTKVYKPAAGYEEFAPYTIVIVKLDEGPMLLARLTDLGDEEPEIGMRVEMVTRILKIVGEHGIIVYGPAFRPLLVPEPKAAG